MSHWKKRIRDLGTQDRARYEQRAEAFEEAWADSSSVEPAIESFLEEGAVRLPLLVHLVKCDLEFRQGRGETRHVEEYLRRFPELESDRDALLEVVLCETHLAVGSGVQSEELLRRFPALQAQLASLLSTLRSDGEWTPPVEYEAIEEVGRGNWGVVYKARHRRLNRFEAVKAVAPGMANAAKVRARIQRLRQEIPIAARLNHPNIVHVYGDGESSGVPYFAMEFCPGGSLRERIEQAPFAPDNAARLIATLATAVHHIHVFGHIHRDLKPSNILFGDDGVPKVADFGLALSRDESDRLEIAGTPLYMAPEQIDPARGKIDCATDVYALGVILFEMLAKNPPFRGSNTEDLYRKILEEPPPPLVGVPNDLAAIVMKCLAKSPQDRYPTGRALAEDLETFLRGGLVGAVRHSPARRVVHWIRTNAALTATAGAVVVAAGAFAWFQTLEWRREIERANDQRIHAEQLAESERKREHAAQVEAARQGARRGDWPTALAAFGRAIDDRQSDHLRLRVERLVGLFAINDMMRFAAELDALEKEPLNELAAQVKLLKAAWAACDFARQGEGRILARQALERRDDLFSDADRHFAEGLAADRVGAALRAFERAAKSDPFHHLAGGCYAVALACVGEREKALRQTEFLRGVFPASPMPEIADTIVAVNDGDRTALEAKLRLVAAKLPTKPGAAFERMRNFLLVLIDLQDVSVRFAEGNDTFADLLNGPALILKARNLGGIPNLEPLALPIPAVSLYVGRLLEIVTAYAEVGVRIKTGFNPETTLRRLDAIVDDYPDSMLLLVQAIMRLRLAIEELGRRDMRSTNENLRAASDSCVRATESPTLTPRLPTPYLALGLGTIVDLARSRFDPTLPPQHLLDLRLKVARLANDGRRWPKLRQGIAGFAADVATVPLTPAQAADWKIDSKEGMDAFRIRRRAILDSCSQLLDGWSIDEPSNPVIVSLRTRVRNAENDSGLTPTKQEIRKK